MPEELVQYGVAVALILVAVVAVIVVYNGIISRMNAVERAWANVIVQERQKNKMIPHLEEVVRQHRDFEAALQSKITELRSALHGLSPDHMDVGKLADAETKTTGLLQGLRVAVEDYPDLKSSETYRQLMREISEQQDNIGAAIRIFNSNVEDFNNGIEMFPNSLVNALLNKKTRLMTFADAQAQAGFEYSPNIH